MDAGALDQKIAIQTASNTIDAATGTQRDAFAFLYCTTLREAA